MNHTDYIEKRDELLDAYRNHELQVAGGVYINDDPKLSYAEAAQAIDALVLQVIGDNVVPANEYSVNWTDNNLKSEQRRIVTGDN